MNDPGRTVEAVQPAANDADRRWMKKALELARRGLNTTDPNPRVGCLLVKNNECVGSGWHRRAGEEHAEKLALEDAGSAVRAATCYVTLEPCSHTGRTGPCADALVQAGVARVVCASGDPNPRVQGAGERRLREAGVEFRNSVLEAEARELNPGYFSRWERGRPWVRVKLAASLDGRTAWQTARANGSRLGKRAVTGMPGGPAAPPFSRESALCWPMIPAWMPDAMIWGK